MTDNRDGVLCVIQIGTRLQTAASFLDQIEADSPDIGAVVESITGLRGSLKLIEMHCETLAKLLYEKMVREGDDYGRGTIR